MYSSNQLLDILLNRHECDDVVSMLRRRADERVEAARKVAALPDGIPQRTPEWYAARKGMLTASEFKIAGSDEVSQAYVMGKVFPAPFSTNDAMTWGCRFEDLACAVYEFEHNTKVREYGLLLHPDATWIGASPDGITEYGVMIEIKNPFSRKRVEIDKRVADKRPFPKSDKANLHGRYRAQIQGQLEVCDLDICDFVVSHVDEVDPEVFWQLRRVADTRHRYAIVVDVPGPDTDGGAVAYKTSPVQLDDDGLYAWLIGLQAVAPNAHVWYVHVRDFGVERVERDRVEWARIRRGLGRTKDAIDAVMAGAEPMAEQEVDAKSGDARATRGNPSLFGPDEAAVSNCFKGVEKKPLRQPARVPARPPGGSSAKPTSPANLSMFSMEDDM